MTMNTLIGRASELEANQIVIRRAKSQTLAYFVLAVVGFSFWFFMAVPFATHRESYSWLAGVQSQGLARSLSFITVTYRPFAQVATWLGFEFLNPGVFPTSVLRQTLLQCSIYGMFVVAWWLIYSAAAQWRLFALVAFVTGGVFFSGYVHLFHIYGIFYVPVMLTLGALLRFDASSALDKREVWLAVAAILLVFWHPFATALFLGFYFGFYLDTFRQRSRAQHFQAVAILLAGATAIGVMVGVFGRADVVVPLHTRFAGFLESYRTNEVNGAASLVAFLLTLLVVFSMGLSPRLKWTVVVAASALSVVLVLNSLPVLLLWLSAALVKLLLLRRWSLFFLTLAAALLPIGGIIGAPVFALYAIILAAYTTPIGWLQGENAIAGVKTQYVAAAILALAAIDLMVRVGIDIPIVTRVANPLLAERERTYQLENALAWLHHSDYCGYEVAFSEDAGSPIDSAGSVLARRNRPPAAIEDVEYFWDTVLRCNRSGQSNGQTSTAVVTFGGQPFADSSPVLTLGGKYAGDATVWIRNSQR